MVDLYIETNIFFRIAEGHDPWSKQFFSIPPPSKIRIFIPNVCFMEAFSTMEDISKTFNGRAEGIRKYADTARRDLIPGPASKVASLLEAARLMELKHFNDVQGRFYEAVDNISKHAQVIDLQIPTLRLSLTQKVLENSPTDNLILHVIANHAQNSGVSDRAFVSGNTKDFQKKQDVTDFLKSYNIRYFPSLNNAVSWGLSV